MDIRDHGGSFGGGGGGKIVGQGEATATYMENINAGELVTTRRYLGFDTLLKVANPDVLPQGNVNTAGVVFSPNDTYMLVTIANAVRVYKRNGDVFSKLSDVAMVSTPHHIVFSNDGKYAIAVANISTTPAALLTFNGDTVTVSYPFSKINSDEYGIIASPSFSNDDNLVVIASTSGGPQIYRNNKDGTFTYLSALVSTVGQATSYRFSPNGSHLFCTGGSSPYVNIWSYTGETFTKLSNPAALPPNSATAVAISPDSVHFAVSHIGGDTITIYKRSGDVFTKLTKPDVLPTGGPYYTNSTGYDGIDFSSDGSYLAVAHATSPFITVWKRNGDSFNKIPNPSILPTGQGLSLKYARLNAYLAVGHLTTPFITIYKGDMLGDFIHKYTSIDELYRPNFINFGYAKNTGLANDTNKKVVTIPIK